MPSATGLLKCSLAVTAVLTLLSISTFATPNGAQATGTAMHFLWSGRARRYRAGSSTTR